MTPLSKRGFGPLLVRYVFHPSWVSVLCFSCAKIHDRADQKLFWRGPNIVGRARSLVRFPPPVRFAPPRSTAQSSIDSQGINCVIHNSLMVNRDCRYYPPHIQIIILTSSKCSELIRSRMTEQSHYIVSTGLSRGL